MTFSLGNMRKIMQVRGKMDRQMSSIWILFYLFPFCVSVIAVGFIIIILLEFISSIDFTNPQLYQYSYGSFPQEFELVLVTVGITILVNFVVSTICTYLLVNRRNTHFRRQKLLSDDIVAAVNSLAKMKYVEADVNLLTLERSLREASIEKNEKSPILWAILSAIFPFLQLYVFYFLMKDFYIHEQREDGFWEDLSRILNKFGVNFFVPRRTEHIPCRSFVLYLILTIVTVGLFVVYWFFVILKDPNKHFKYHVDAETHLLSTLEPLEF